MNYTARDYIEAAQYLQDPIDLGSATADELAGLVAAALAAGWMETPVADFLAAPVGKRLSRDLGTTEAATFARESYIGTYPTREHFGEERREEWEEMEVTTAWEYVDAVDAAGNGMVDFVPAAAGGVHVFIEG